MNPVLFRALLALGIVVIGLGTYAAINRVILRRAAKNYLGLADYTPGHPAVLYFTMEGCIPCKTTQRPALDRLSEMTGGKVQIIRVDAVEQPDLVESWGVLSVPTTFIIDTDGQPRRVNHGVALAEKLLAQLEEVTESSLSVDGSTKATETALPISGD